MNELTALEKWIVQDARRRDEREWREQEQLATRLVEECQGQLDEFLFRIRQAYTVHPAWQKFADERSKAFNRRYYNNPDGEPVFKY